MYSVAFVMFIGIIVRRTVPLCFLIHLHVHAYVRVLLQSYLMEDLKHIIQWCLSMQIPFVCFRYPGEQAVLWACEDPVERGSLSSMVFEVQPFTLSDARALYFSPSCVFDSGAVEDFKDRVSAWSRGRAPVLPAPYVYEKESYLQDLQACIGELMKGGVEKVILSRIRPSSGIGINAVPGAFEAIEQAFPDALCYIFSSPYSGCWLGASPERLLLRQQGCCYTEALAGTQSVQNICIEPTWGEKEQEEHRYVSDYIRQCLLEEGVDALESLSVETIVTGSLCHMRTGFRFYKEGDVSSLLEALHPTPAIGGYPRQGALAMIDALERSDRSYYCGYLGLCDRFDETRLYVNLRCMQVQKDKAYLYAGGGLTLASDPMQEWQETEDKMNNLLRVLITRLGDE